MEILGNISLGFTFTVAGWYYWRTHIAQDPLLAQIRSVVVKSDDRELASYYNEVTTYPNEGWIHSPQYTQWLTDLRKTRALIKPELLAQAYCVDQLLYHMADVRLLHDITASAAYYHREIREQARQWMLEQEKAVCESGPKGLSGESGPKGHSS